MTTVMQHYVKIYFHANPLSRIPIIQWATGSKWVHAGLVVQDYYNLATQTCKLDVIEAHLPWRLGRTGVRRNTISGSIKKIRKTNSLAVIPVSREMYDSVYDLASKLVGAKYDLNSAILLGLRMKFKLPIGNFIPDNEYFCSELVSECLYAADIEFYEEHFDGVKPEYMSPGMLYEYCMQGGWILW